MLASTWRCAWRRRTCVRRERGLRVCSCVRRRSGCHGCGGPSGIPAATPLRWTSPLSDMATLLALSSVPGATVTTRGCHGYIPEEYIHALYPYPLRIRAEDAYPKCIMRKKREVISILSDKICEIISHPYPRNERQDTGIYKIMKLLAPAEF